MRILPPQSAVLSARIIIPKLELRVDNAEATVRAMTGSVEDAISARAERGVGADGRALPRPKDAGSAANPDGRAYNRTGRLAVSIASVVRTGRKGEPVGVVRPFGDRPESEGVAAKVVAAKLSTRARRAEARAAGRSRRGIRSRTAETNASLAAILSQPPRDRRARNGGREVYRVVEASDEEQARATAVGRGVIRTRLVTVGTTEIK